MPSLGDTRIIDFSVNCMKPPHTVRKMQIWLTFFPDGKWYPPGCGGCEEATANKECKDCMNALTLMFVNDPDLDVFEPITPDLKLLPKAE